MRQKLNMITIGVADIARSKAFYEGIGWQQSPKSMDDLIIYPLGGMLLALYPNEALAEDIGIAASQYGFSGITLGLNTHSKEEVDQVLADVRPYAAVAGRCAPSGHKPARALLAQPPRQPLDLPITDPQGHRRSLDLQPSFRHLPQHGKPLRLLPWRAGPHTNSPKMRARAWGRSLSPTSWWTRRAAADG